MDGDQLLAWVQLKRKLEAQITGLTTERDEALAERDAVRGELEQVLTISNNLMVATNAALEKATKEQAEAAALRSALERIVVRVADPSGSYIMLLGSAQAAESIAQSALQSTGAGAEWLTRFRAMEAALQKIKIGAQQCQDYGTNMQPWAVKELAEEGLQSTEGEAGEWLTRYRAMEAVIEAALDPKDNYCPICDGYFGGFVHKHFEGCPLAAFEQSTEGEGEEKCDLCARALPPDRHHWCEWCEREEQERNEHKAGE